MTRTLAKNQSFLKLSTPIQYIKGVGPKIAEIFNKRGIKTVEDILTYYPRVYEDRKSGVTIASLQAGQLVSISATVIQVSAIPLGRTGRKIHDILVRDKTGSIRCKFFRVPYKGYFDRFPLRKEIQIIGKTQMYRGNLEFHHPELRELSTQELEQDCILPIYTEIELLTSAKISKAIQTILSDFPDEEWQESLPASVLKKYQLMDRKQAFFEVHRPSNSLGPLLIKYQAPSQIRFIFEEFFWFELSMVRRLSQFQEVGAPKIEVSSKFLADIKSALPFELTGAQSRVLGEIFFDIAKPNAMNRLVQGDVGSGKTMVAFIAALAAIQKGYQVALMAPTEILAEQHLKNARRFFDQFSIKVGYLVGSTPGSLRKETLDQLERNQVSLLIGTHALIEDSVQFTQLGLVIVDEQHRFGVQQRTRLKQKGGEPHFLLMTATPIPRTLALTLYGDLDVSVIDELPKGRTPIITRVTTESKRPQVYSFIKEQVQEGRQAYVVYPLVEESEKIELKNATEEFEKLKVIFPQFRIALLHGKMKSQDKDTIMRQFRDHKVDILVSTTVIEVGVDVPNASIMLIEHAERFGLSQLHQLRGRVGRGPYKSYCILLPGFALSEEGRYRLSIMESTSDGFKVSQADLELRGPGEFLGLRQSGDMGFKLANLIRDEQLLLKARQAAIELLTLDPKLQFPEHAYVSERLKRARVTS